MCPIKTPMILFPHDFPPIYIVSISVSHNLGPFILSEQLLWLRWLPGMKDVVTLSCPHAACALHGAIHVSDFKFCKLITLFLSSRPFQILLPLPLLLFFLLLNGVISLMLWVWDWTCFSSRKSLLRVKVAIFPHWTPIAHWGQSNHNTLFTFQFCS